MMAAARLEEVERMVGVRRRWGQAMCSAVFTASPDHRALLGRHCS